MLEAIVGGLPPVGLLAIVAALCATTVMLAFSVMYPAEAGPQYWAPANMLALVSITMLVLRSPQSDVPVALGGSAGFVFAYLLLWIGYLRFLGRRPPWLAAFGIMAVYLAALAWFEIAAPNPGLRSGSSSLAVAVLAGATCCSLVRHMQVNLLQSQAVTALLFGALAVGNLARALVSFSGRLAGTGFHDGPLGYGLYLIPAVVLLLLAASTGMMLIQRRRSRLTVPASGAALPPPGPGSPSAAGDLPPR